MQQLIQQVQDALLFDVPQGSVCADECKGSSLKLLDYMDMELMAWEDRLDQGKVPGLKWKLIQVKTYLAAKDAKSAK